MPEKSESQDAETARSALNARLKVEAKLIIIDDGTLMTSECWISLVRSQLRTSSRSAHAFLKLPASWSVKLMHHEAAVLNS